MVYKFDYVWNCIQYLCDIFLIDYRHRCTIQGLRNYILKSIIINGKKSQLSQNTSLSFLRMLVIRQFFDSKLITIIIARYPYNNSIFMLFLHRKIWNQRVRNLITYLLNNEHTCYNILVISWVSQSRHIERKSSWNFRMNSVFRSTQRVVWLLGVESNLSINMNMILIKYIHILFISINTIYKYWNNNKVDFFK